MVVSSAVIVVGDKLASVGQVIAEAHDVDITFRDR